MAVRKYFYKNPDEIISQLNSYRGNIRMVWDAATEAAEERLTSTTSAMAKPHRAVCGHCYGSKDMCDNCDNGSRFYPLCRADGVASA